MNDFNWMTIGERRPNGSKMRVTSESICRFVCGALSAGSTLDVKMSCFGFQTTPRVMMKYSSDSMCLVSADSRYVSGRRSTSERSLDDHLRRWKLALARCLMRVSCSSSASSLEAVPVNRSSNGYRAAMGCCVVSANSNKGRMAWKPADVTP